MPRYYRNCMSIPLRHPFEQFLVLFLVCLRIAIHGSTSLQMLVSLGRNSLSPSLLKFCAIMKIYSVWYYPKERLLLKFHGSLTCYSILDFPSFISLLNMKSEPPHLEQCVKLIGNLDNLQASIYDSLDIIDRRLFVMLLLKLLKEH